MRFQRHTPNRQRSILRPCTVAAVRGRFFCRPFALCLWPVDSRVGFHRSPFSPLFCVFLRGLTRT
nr:MAG TPA: hypothetical protein [Caudoviricetes sp.]